MPIKKIYDPIYDNTIHFIFDVKREECRKYLQDKIGCSVKEFNNRYEFSNGFASVDDNLDPFIVIPNSKSMNKDISIVLAHECLHVTSRCLRNIGISLSDESEEAFAYYHTWLMNSVMNIYEQHYKSKKRKKNNL